MRMIYSILLAFSLALGACSSSGNNEETQTNAEVDAAIAQIRTVETEISQGLLLYRSSEKSRESVEDLLYRARLSLYRLKKAPSDNEAFNELSLTIDSLSSFPVPETDEYPMYNLISGLRSVQQTLSAITGNSVYGLLFREQFLGGIGAFEAVDVEGEVARWRVRATDDGIVQISGFSRSVKDTSDNWLISPRMDVSETGEAAFEVSQAYSYYPKADEVQILISTDFTGGSPLEASWTEVSIENLPNSSLKNSPFVTSEKISLENYKDTPFVVAFRYRSTPDASGTWKIDFLKLYGTGKLGLTSWK